MLGSLGKAVDAVGGRGVVATAAPLTLFLPLHTVKTSRVGGRYPDVCCLGGLSVQQGHERLEGDPPTHHSLRAVGRRTFRSG